MITATRGCTSRLVRPRLTRSLSRREVHTLPKRLQFNTFRYVYKVPPRVTLYKTRPPTLWIQRRTIFSALKKLFRGDKESASAHIEEKNLDTETVDSQAEEVDVDAPVTVQQIRAALDRGDYEFALQASLKLYSLVNGLNKTATAFALDTALFSLMQLPGPREQEWSLVNQYLENSKHESAVVNLATFQALAARGHELLAMDAFHQACKVGFDTYFEKAFKTMWIYKMTELGADLCAMEMILCLYYHSIGGEEAVAQAVACRFKISDSVAAMLAEVGKFMPALVPTSVTMNITTLKNAETMLEYALLDYPNAPTLLTMKAQLLVKSGKLEEAIELGNQLIVKHDDWAISKVLACAYLKLKDYKNTWFHLDNYMEHRQSAELLVIPARAKLAYVLYEQDEAALEPMLTFRIDESAISRPSFSSHQLTVIETLLIQAAIMHKTAKRKYARIFYRSARGLISYWKHHRFLNLSDPAVSQKAEDAIKTLAIMEVNSLLASGKTEKAEALKAQFNLDNTEFDVEKLFEIRGDELDILALDDIVEWNEEEFKDYCIQQAKIADRLLLAEEAEAFLKYTSRSTPFWYITSIKIALSIPRDADVNPNFHPLGLAAEFVEDYPKLRAAWGAQAMASLTLNKINDNVTAKDYEFTLFSIRNALQAPDLDYAEEFTPSYLCYMAAEAIIKLNEMLGHHKDEIIMKRELEEFSKEFPHRIRHYLASAYIIWAADPYLEASTINALISAAQSLLDSLPEEYKETYEVKMAIARIKLLRGDSDALQYVADNKPEDGGVELFINYIDLLVMAKQYDAAIASLDPIMPNEHGPGEYTSRKSLLISMFAAIVALVADEATKVFFERSLKKVIMPQLPSPYALGRLWTALTRQLSTTLSKEEMPTIMTDLGAPTTEPTVSIEWRHQALAYYEALKLASSMPPALQRMVIARLTEMNLSVAKEGAGRLYKDLLAGRPVWDFDRIEKCAYWHSLAVEKVVESLRKADRKSKKKSKAS